MNTSSGTIKTFHTHSIVIDMHAHPPLKTFLFNKRFYKKHKTGGV